MTYVVLARKYRPQTFAEIVGQDHISRTLQNAIRLGRLHHAYLFTGTRGIGKTTTARIFAKALCCDRFPTEEPCNECPSCVEITKGSSPDVIEIDGASNNGVEDIRTLRENVNYRPTHGNFRIYIIDEVHMLTTAAFNALLKTLEEPPAHVKFIFATTEPHKLPDTIISRVQRHDCKKASVTVIVDHLGSILKREDIEFEPTALVQIAKEAAGSIRDGLSLLDQVIAYADKKIDDEVVRQLLGAFDRAQLFGLSQAVIDKDAGTALTRAHAILELGTDVRYFVGELAEQFRNLVVAKSAAKPGELMDLPPGELEEMKEQAGKAQLDELLRCFHIVHEASDGIIRSPFAHLVLEMTIVRMCQVGPVRSMDSILEKIGTLQRTVGGGGYRSGPASAQGGGHGPKAGGGPRDPGEMRSKPTEHAPASGTPPFDPASRKPPIKQPARSDRPAPAPQAPVEPPAGPPAKSWEELVTRIENDAPSIGADLQLVRCLSFEPDAIKLGLENTVAAQRLSASARKEKLENLIRKHTGGQANLQLETIAAGDTADLPPSLYEERLVQQKKLEKEASRMAMSGSTLKNIQKHFGEPEHIRVRPLNLTDEAE